MPSELLKNAAAAYSWYNNTQEINMQINIRVLHALKVCYTCFFSILKKIFPA